MQTKDKKRVVMICSCGRIYRFHRWERIPKSLMQDLKTNEKVYLIKTVCSICETRKKLEQMQSI